MTKAKLPGYILPEANTLDNITSPTENMVGIIADRKVWALYDESYGSDSLASYNNFVYLPVTTINTKNTNISTVTVNSTIATLDFSILNKFIDITLNSNTVLSFTNLLKGQEYFIRIVCNNYLIENIFELADYPQSYTINTLYKNFNVLLLKLTSTLTTQLTPCFLEENTNRLLYNYPTTKVFQVTYFTDSSDTGANTYSVSSEGTPTITSQLLDLDGGRLVYTKDSNTNLNETNFSLEFWLTLENGDEYGSIVSIWNDSSKQFWCRVNESQLLTCSFNEGTQIVNLSTSLTGFKTYHVYINRIRNTYRLVINGELASTVTSTNFMVNSSANLVVGRLENATNEGTLAAISFTGYISNIVLSKSVVNNYEFEHTPTYRGDEGLLYRFFIRESEYINDLSFINKSITSTYPFLVTNQRNNYTALDKYHHFEVDGTDFLAGISEDFTVDVWMKNITSNTRGTLLNLGDNWHFGIYDNKLQLDINYDTSSWTHTVTSISSVIDEQWHHVAFTREGTIYRIYLDGTLEGSVDVTTNGLMSSTNLAIKRAVGQDTTVAAVNTSLYPSKSHISIDNIRIIIGEALYTGSSFVVSEYF